MTLYIGIDQSYRSSGIVAVDDTGAMRANAIIRTDTSNGDYFKRAGMASEAIAERIAPLTLHGAEIGLEGLAFGMRGHTLQNLAGLQFMIVNALRRRGNDVNIYTPSRVKKFATGNGRAKKDDMFDALPDDIKAIFKKVSKANGREDLTDAYFIAQLLRTK